MQEREKWKKVETLPVVQLAPNWLQFRFVAADINIYYNEILSPAPIIEHLCMRCAIDEVIHSQPQIQLQKYRQSKAKKPILNREIKLFDKINSN